MNLSTHIVMFQSKRREKKKRQQSTNGNAQRSCFLFPSTVNSLERPWSLLGFASDPSPLGVSNSCQQSWMQLSRPFSPFSYLSRVPFFCFLFLHLFFFRQVSLQEPDFILHLGCCVSTLTALHRHIVRLSYVRQFGYALASAGVLPHRTRGRLPRHPRSFGWQL